MKIAILIPSRNRPRQLSAVITSLHEMESGENDIEYRIGCDADDDTTIELLFDPTKSFGFLVKSFLIREQITIGAIWNYLAQDAADLYSCMIDDAFSISPHWDKIMQKMVAQGIHAMSWYEVSAPLNVGYPTCTKEWLEKVGQIVPEHYPFWFMDTEYGEMVHYMTNKGVPVHQQLALFSKQEVTQNLRELDFWWGFHNATRMLRLKKAYDIVKPEMSFEEFTESRKHFLEASKTRDAEFRGARIEQLEKERGAKGDPPQKYLLAKYKAEKYLVDQGLTIWCGLDK